jgi:hypothetical protein
MSAVLNVSGLHNVCSEAAVARQVFFSFNAACDPAKVR